MKVNLYSCFDTKAKAFNQPFFFQNNELALRAFANVINDSSHPMGKNPEDFSLYVIGHFDDSNGELVDQEPELVAIGQQVLKTSIAEITKDHMESLP